MNILVDCRHLNTQSFGGVGEYTTELLHALFAISDEHTYTLLTSGVHKPLLEQLFAHTCYSKNNSLYSFPSFVHQKHISVPNKQLNAQMILTKKPTLDAFLDEKPDLIFLPNITIACLPTDIPTVTMVHDLSWMHFPHVYSWKMRLWHKAVLRQNIFSQTSAFLTPSESTKQDLVRAFHLLPESIFPIAHGVSSRFQPKIEAKDHSIRSKYKLPKWFILFVGTLEPRKNISTLIDAVYMYRERYRDDISLVLVGPWGWKTRELRRKLAEHNTASWVRVLNHVSKNQLPALYRSASLFVWPSFYEGFGLPILEAMTSGIPVITSPISSMPEVTKQAALYVDPYQTQDLCAAIHHVLSSSALQEHMKKSGLEQSQMFRWETAAKQTLQVFEKTIK